MTPSKLAGLLPPSIRVGPFDVGIRLIDDAESEKVSSFGMFHWNELRIDIASGAAVPGPVKVVDTFLHELLHAILNVYAVNCEKTTEEDIVSISATAWTQVYRDNPWLLDWIKKGLAKG